MRNIKLKEKFLNSLNYYTGIRNISYFCKYFFKRELKKVYPKPWSCDLFANTIFQGKK